MQLMLVLPRKLIQRASREQTQLLFPIVVPITETTEINPPIRRIKGSCVRRYTNAVKTTNAERPATFTNAILVPGPTDITRLDLLI